METITYVGLDVHKATVSVALAESGRGGEVRQVGVFDNRPEVLTKLATRLSKGGVSSLSVVKPTPAVMGCTASAERSRSWGTTVGIPPALL